MESMNMEIINLITNLQWVKASQKNKVKDMPETDLYGFPFEPYEEFSTEPLSFFETAMRLETEASQTFAMLREFNRHSPLFYQMSSDLEKIVSQLGSACITKAVIQMQGESSVDMDELLGSLTIDKLRGWAAFNFRKCYASFMESIADVFYNKTAMNLSIRWAALDKRLIATAEKIEQIQAGKIKIDLKPKPQEQEAQAEQASSEAAEPTENKPAAALSGNGRALPIDKSMVRQAGNDDEGVRIQDSGIRDSDFHDSLADPDSFEKGVRIQDSGIRDSVFRDSLVDPDSEYKDEGFRGQDSVIRDSDAHSLADMDRADLPEELRENDQRGDENHGCSYDDEAEDLPCVSEEIVRRMSELIHARESIPWPFPQFMTDPP